MYGRLVQLFFEIERSIELVIYPFTGIDVSSFSTR